ncbi:MAG: flavodoxin domain-containing protein [Nocardioidaceae bacterium]
MTVADLHLRPFPVFGYSMHGPGQGVRLGRNVPAAGDLRTCFAEVPAWCAGRMKGLVVYESLFGNTEQVAHAVARGLRTRMEVTVVPAAEAPAPLTDLVDLVVVGGPTAS